MNKHQNSVTKNEQMKVYGLNINKHQNSVTYLKINPNSLAFQREVCSFFKN
jgi:hypothetical protein